MADNDIPAEAVEAAVSKQREVCWLGDPSEREAMRAALAAALPHIRARILAEVDAALRDRERFLTWAETDGQHVTGEERIKGSIERKAAYLRDVLNDS
jgi:hypothetical protein